MGMYDTFFIHPSFILRLCDEMARAIKADLSSTTVTYTDDVIQNSIKTAFSQASGWQTKDFGCDLTTFQVKENGALVVESTMTDADDDDADDAIKQRVGFDPLSRRGTEFRVSLCEIANLIRHPVEKDVVRTYFITVDGIIQKITGTNGIDSFFLKDLKLVEMDGRWDRFIKLFDNFHSVRGWNEDPIKRAEEDERDRLQKVINAYAHLKATPRTRALSLINKGTRGFADTVAMKKLRARCIRRNTLGLGKYS